MVKEKQKLLLELLLVLHLGLFTSAVPNFAFCMNAEIMPTASAVDGVAEKLTKNLAALIVHLVDEFAMSEHTVSISRKTFKSACMSSS